MDQPLDFPLALGYPDRAQFTLLHHLIMLPRLDTLILMATQDIIQVIILDIIMVVRIGVVPP